MLLPLLLLPFAHVAPAPADASLLAAVPDDAYVLVHCRDVAALRARAEANDWYRLLASPHGEPLLSELARELRSSAHSDLDELLAMADALQGEVVFFDTGSVAGFVVEPPADRARLAGLMRAWIPDGDAGARRALELAGGRIELVAWPDEVDGWSGRAGHFAAFVDHPLALALVSGDDSAAVLDALTEGVTGLGSDRRAPLASAYLEAGGGQGGGIELYVDFTPLVGPAEAALKDAVEGMLPDPTSLLGLERGTWLHASADVFPGARVDGRARLHLPADTLSARLADTFQPLPATLPLDLPAGTWGLYALGWDLKRFYRRAREAYEQAGFAEGLQKIDAGIEAARGLSGVDPVVDVLDQLAGDFALFFVEPPGEGTDYASDDMRQLASFGFQAGLVDGGAFLTAFERLTEIGGMDSVFELEELDGAEVYLFEQGGGLDGGLAFLPRTFSVAPARRVLERSLRALTRVEGASLLPGTRMQAAIDESAGACFLACVELSPLRRTFFAEQDGDLRLPPLEAGQPARDPFDAQLVATARRTPQGFELRLQTR